MKEYRIGCVSVIQNAAGSEGKGPDSVVLCISTEGDTDPVHYRKIVYEGKNPMPQQA